MTTANEVLLIAVMGWALNAYAIIWLVWADPRSILQDIARDGLILPILMLVFGLVPYSYAILMAAAANQIASQWARQWLEKDQ